MPYKDSLSPDICKGNDVALLHWLTIHTIINTYNSRWYHSCSIANQRIMQGWYSFHVVAEWIDFWQRYIQRPRFDSKQLQFFASFDLFSTSQHQYLVIHSTKLHNLIIVQFLLVHGSLPLQSDTYASTN